MLAKLVQAWEDSERVYEECELVRPPQGIDRTAYIAWDKQMDLLAEATFHTQHELGVYLLQDLTPTPDITIVRLVNDVAYLVEKYTTDHGFFVEVTKHPFSSFYEKVNDV